MKRSTIMLLQALLVAAVSVATAQADEPIGPGHPRWYGQGAGPVGADLINWVAHRATKAAEGQPDPAYYGTAGGPVGADLIAKLARVQKREVTVDLVNTYGQGAPSAKQLAPHFAEPKSAYVAGQGPVVK